MFLEENTSLLEVVRRANEPFESAKKMFGAFNSTQIYKDCLLQNSELIETVRKLNEPFESTRKIFGAFNSTQIYKSCLLQNLELIETVRNLNKSFEGMREISKAFSLTGKSINTSHFNNNEFEKTNLNLLNDLNVNTPTKEQQLDDLYNLAQIQAYEKVFDEITNNDPELAEKFKRYIKDETFNIFLELCAKNPEVSEYLLRVWRDLL